MSKHTYVHQMAPSPTLTQTLGEPPFTWEFLSVVSLATIFITYQILSCFELYSLFLSV